ncbi:MAG: DUF2303 family protein [Rhodospirillaceae bacterium]
MDAPETRYSPADVGFIVGKLQELVEKARKPELIELPQNAALPVTSTNHVLMVPKGMELQSLRPLLAEYFERPQYIRGEARLDTLESFSHYVLRFARCETVIYADTAGAEPKLVAFIDYHGMGGAAWPDWCQHRALYPFPLSAQFEAWLKASDKLFKQAEFAEFIQDREYDIENPPAGWCTCPPEDLATVFDLLNLRPDHGADNPAPRLILPNPKSRPRTALEKLVALRFGRISDLNALARGVEITVGQKFSQKYNPKTGEKELNFSEQHNDAQRSDGTKIIVPNLFLVYIPVFDGGPRQLLPVRLYYRSAGGGISWGVELIDAPRLLRRAIEAAVETVKVDTKVPVLWGEPEPRMLPGAR